MSIQDFINNFAFQLDDTEVSDLSENTIYKDLDEWSSLTTLSIIAMCDEEYGVKIKGDDFKNTSTIKELFELIKSKK
jgi:acyl carrier protein